MDELRTAKDDMDTRSSTLLEEERRRWESKFTDLNGLISKQDARSREHNVLVTHAVHCKALGTLHTVFALSLAAPLLSPSIPRASLLVDRVGKPLLHQDEMDKMSAELAATKTQCRAFEEEVKSMSTQRQEELRAREDLARTRRELMRDRMQLEHALYRELSESQGTYSERNTAGHPVGAAMSTAAVGAGLTHAGPSLQVT